MNQRIFYLSILSICIATLTADAKPPFANGMYRYDITITDQAGQPMDNTQASIMGRGFAVKTTRSGVAVIIIDRLLMPQDTIEVYKWGYLPEKFSFSEDSDGSKSIVLKSDPNPGPNPMEGDSSRKEKKRKTRK
ncbi:hypothetical protein [Alistipes sp.]|uniref:hypothetical protein n=1 Tax=Alistipes sp. TaxID=1872444 RepID=UPI003AF1D90F